MATKPTGNPRGRPAKNALHARRKFLTDEEAAEVRAWYEAQKELGSYRAYRERAMLEYRRLRKQIPSWPEMVKKMGVCRSTLLWYVQSRHKT
jgi:excinuclease UvrABC helicase subunit UvrB